MTDFEEHRDRLRAHAYRMLGDWARAEEVVQDAWLRWRDATDVRDPAAWLTTVTTRLCLNELGSARARREQPAGTRLPDLVSTSAEVGVRAEELSLALLVLVQRLDPDERAVLLLHDVMGYTHAEIGAMLGVTAGASRKRLSRAKGRLRAEDLPRTLDSREQHRALLERFVAASSHGDVEGMLDLLAPEVTLIVDAGPGGVEFGGARNLARPLDGAERVARFVCQVTPTGAQGLTRDIRELNGRPAAVVRRDGRPFAVVAVLAHEGRIRWVFIQADGERLGGL